MDDTTPPADAPLRKDTVALLAAAARELKRAEDAVSAAKVLVEEATRCEWPYDEESSVTSAEDEWKTPGIGALLSISRALNTVLWATRQDSLANAEDFFHRVWVATTEEDLPF